MTMALKLKNVLTVLIAVPLLLLVIFVSALLIFVDRSDQEAKRQERIKTIIATADRLYDRPTLLQRYLIGYVRTQNPAFLQKYKGLVQEMEGDISKLKAMTSENEVQHTLLDQIDAAGQNSKKAMDQFIESVKGSEADTAMMRLQSLSSEIYPLVGQVQSSLREFINEQKRLERESLSSRLDENKKIKILIICLVAGNIVAIPAIWVFFAARTSRRLDVLMRNTNRLGRGEELLPRIEGRDELADLDLVFRNMADALDEAKRREKAVVENAADIICSLDSECRFTKVSPASQKILGYTPEEMIGYYAVEFVDRSAAAHVLDSFKEIVGTPREANFETCMLRKDGSTLYTLWSTYWSQAEEALFCVIHDITERKEAEEALRASEQRVRLIMEQMPIGLVILEQDGTIALVNPAMEQIFKYPVEELVGNQIANLFHDNPAQIVASERAEFTADLFKKSIGHIYEKEQAFRKDGTAFPAHISIAEMETQEGPRLLGIILDVTERHEIERFKREFLGVVSHELRSPLTAIRGSLKLMLIGAMGPQSEQAQKAIAIAERSATRLIGLVNDLLDIEKLEAGKLEMHFELIPIAPVFESSVESVKPFADQHEVKLEWEDTDAVAYADGDRIVQVLINFLSNAIKYSPKGESVVLSAVQHEDELEVRVTDHGRGIPATHVGSLFQRFKQVERADATKKGGTGLGLAICKAIVEQHLGTIGVDSELGKGSTFWFRLPSREVAASKSTEVIRDGGDQSDKERIGVGREIV